MWPCVKIAVSSRLRRPPPHRLVHRLGVEHAARVDDHQPVVGVDHRRVGEGVDERDARAAPRPARRSAVNGWCSSIGSSPVNSRSAVSSRSMAREPARPRVVASGNRNVFHFCDRDHAPSSPGALARSQAARRRRVLDATLALAADGGFDAVQMRDVAAAADVALGTVYRYFSSKERLLLEAMAEQQADLRALPRTRTRRRRRPPAERVIAVLGRSNRSLRALPRRDRGDGAGVRLGRDRERRHRAPGHRDHDRRSSPARSRAPSATRRPSASCASRGSSCRCGCRR